MATKRIICKRHSACFKTLCGACVAIAGWSFLTIESSLARAAADNLTAIAPRREQASQVDLIAKLRTAGGIVNVNGQGDIEEVYLGDKATDELIEELAPVRSLRHLNLHSDQTTLRAITAIGHMNGLAYLSLPGMFIGDEGLQRLSKLKRLKRLNLDENGITDAGLESLAGMTELSTLTLAGNQLSDRGLAQLAELTELEELDLSNSSVADSAMRIGDAGLAQLAPLKKLRMLRFERTNITGAGLRHLQNFPLLQQLQLAGDSINDEGMPHVAKCEQLTSLGLVYTSVGDKGMAHVANLKRLVRFSLSSRLVTDAGIANLSGLTSLEHVELRASLVADESLAHMSKIGSLTRLDLYGNSNTGPAAFGPGAGGGEFTGDGIAHLVALPKLRTLWLNNFDLAGSATIFDSTRRAGPNRAHLETVSQLAKLKQLKSLTLCFGDVRADQIAELEKALPDTTISGGPSSGAAFQLVKPKAGSARPAAEKRPPSP